MTNPVCIGTWFQGPTGSGQGGWTAHRLKAAINEAGEPAITVAIRRPIPLETDLVVHEVNGEWHLVEVPSPDQPVLVAQRWQPHYADTPAVSIAQAEEAKTRFPLHDEHPVPVCFSCGQESDSMQVHSGPLQDGRWATDWRVPDWAVQEDGAVDDGALWAAIDCAQAWYAGNDGGRRHAVTVQLAVEVLIPLQPGETYALVAWPGTYPREWDGRKRGAGGAAFDRNGQLVAPLIKLLARHVTICDPDAAHSAH